MADTQHIASLILKEKLTLLSFEERNELNEWLSEDPANSKLYKDFQEYDFHVSYDRRSAIDPSKALKTYKMKYRVRKHSSIIKWGLSSAASLLILFLGYYMFNQFGGVTKPEVISAGSSKALLVLSNGEKINLGEPIAKEQIVDGSNVIKNKEHTLNYQTQDKTTKQNLFNELIIPIGGEYKIELSDGTIVWMNSMSKLRFPVVFDSTERNVFLEGEAYFEVAKDSLRPFNVVIRDNLKVTVLGTSFNVRAYNDEESVETVLEEGAVIVDGNGNRAMLHPNQRASYNNRTNSILIDNVETRNYTSWHKGHFVFNEMSVEKILSYISKWYSFEVEYQNDTVKNIIFSGSLKKYEDLTKFLTAIELAGGVKFEISENKLIVAKQLTN